MSNPITDGYSLQKVNGAIRKAGLQKARWNRSGLVRGWGDWQSGVRVERSPNQLQIYVYYQRGRWSKATEQDDVAECDKISAALDSSSIAHTRSLNLIACIVEAKTQ